MAAETIALESERLRGLPHDVWSRPTVRTDWDVRDVVLHILGGDLSKLCAPPR
jgi:hypothetical protein